MLIAENLYEEIKQVLSSYRNNRIPEKLLDSCVHKPLEYLNLHTSATYFVEQEMAFIQNSKSPELKKLCDLSILLEGLMKYLREQKSQRLILALEPLKTKLWDTGDDNDFLHFSNEFETATNNAAQLINMNSGQYKQWQYQKTFFTNPLLAGPPSYRTGDKHSGETDGKIYTISPANMGPRYSQYIDTHTPQDLLANFGNQRIY